MTSIFDYSHDSETLIGKQKLREQERAVTVEISLVDEPNKYSDIPREKSQSPQTHKYSMNQTQNIFSFKSKQKGVKLNIHSEKHSPRTISDNNYDQSALLSNKSKLNNTIHSGSVKDNPHNNSVLVPMIGDLPKISNPQSNNNQNNNSIHTNNPNNNLNYQSNKQGQAMTPSSTSHYYDTQRNSNQDQSNSNDQKIDGLKLPPVKIRNNLSKSMGTENKRSRTVIKGQNQSSQININSNRQSHQAKYQLIPPDCVVEYPKQTLSKLGEVLLQQNKQIGSNFNRRKVMFKQIQEKIDDLQEEYLNNQKSQLVNLNKSKREQQLHRDMLLRQEMEKQIKVKLQDPNYFKEMFVGDNEKYFFYLQQSGDSPKNKLRNRRDSIDKKKKSNEQKQMSVQLKIEEDIHQMAQKYGIVPKEKYGDTIAVNSNQENLKKIVEKHYRRTKMRNFEDSVKEMRNFFNINNPLKRSDFKNLSEVPTNNRHQKIIKFAIGNLAGMDDISNQIQEQSFHSFHNQPSDSPRIIVNQTSLSIKPALKLHQQSKSAICEQITNDRKKSQDVFHEKLISRKKSTFQPTSGSNQAKTTLNSPSEHSLNNDDQINLTNTQYLLTQNTQSSRRKIDAQTSIEDFTQSVKQRLTSLIGRQETARDSEFEQSAYLNRETPDFIGTILVPDQSQKYIHVANKYQFQEVQKLFNQYYQYKEPELKNKLDSHHKSFKKMSLRDIEKLSNAKNILKFDLDRKLSKHLNFLLSNRKEDQFFNEKYMAYVKNIPKQEKGEQSIKRIQKLVNENRIRTNASPIVELRLNELKSELMNSKSPQGELLQKIDLIEKIPQAQTIANSPSFQRSKTIIPQN